ncbi:hypothetical protein BFJ68_g5734 [Fusarium oxysporum]|uniref:Uncharacterized protein n=1 Tax=Fusarium oxysporum TaxID=5507 RepID=A0A420P602_FUSOX|nr:hypothetical protein BFJ71_g13173 [Fusarium oxysporum]RKL15527.1 hypothetical protein BFJ68_g5734 [Fusarium oxysporum]
MYKILAPLEPVSRRTSQPGYQPGWLEDKPILREGVLTPGVVEEGCAVLPAVRSMSICSAINATESEPVDITAPRYNRSGAFPIRHR